jgi:hypothetical protein
MGEGQWTEGGRFDGAAGAGEGASARQRRLRAAAELLSRRPYTARARSVRFQVECVLLLFEEAGLAATPAWQWDVELAAHSPLLSGRPRL